MFRLFNNNESKSFISTILNYLNNSLGHMLTINDIECNPAIIISIVRGFK